MGALPRGIKGSGVDLIPVSPGQWGLIEEWLAYPVAREYWYEGPDFNMRWLRQIVERDTGEVLIIELHGEAIGVAAWEWWFPESDPEPEELRRLIEPGTCNYDVLIADARNRNRGLGIKVVRLMEHRLWAIPDCRMISAVSRSDHAIVSKMLKVLGYRVAGTAEEPGIGPVTLFLKHRPADAP